MTMPKNRKEKGCQMDLKIFFKRQLKFGHRLKRLHHANALLFVLLTITGFILFSVSFRSTFPSVRVWVRDGHVWVGIVSCLPLLFYVPKMARHLGTLKRKLPHRMNLYFILLILVLLIISGLILTLHRQFPPVLSALALYIHDAVTIIGVPYVAYHSITRSRWFKELTHGQGHIKQDEPMVINEVDPIYKRRTFLKVATVSLLGIAFGPFYLRWFRVVFPPVQTKPNMSKGNHFSPLPKPSSKSSPPIGGGRQGSFRFYTVTETPNLNDHTFHFIIDGLVKRPKKYRWNDFLHLPRDVQISDFHCVTGWSVYHITWEGIPLKSLLNMVGVQPQANYVKFYSADGVYTDTLTLKQAMEQDIMIALLIDGKMIDQQNGGPVRLIVPKMYAYKSVKWLNHIELIDHDATGYWEKRGYPKNAWIKPM